MADRAPDVSVVVVSWNVREVLRECLSAVREEGSGCVREVWVVDNASADGSAEMVADEFPEVRLGRNPENLGFSRACNQALRQARGPVCVLLNPDARVCPGALAALARFLEAHPHAGAAGPRLFNPDGTLQPNGGPFPALLASLLRAICASALFRDWFDRRFRWGRSDFARAVEVEQVSGACLAIRRIALEAVGLLDEEYFLYFEEVDWLRRARQAGWQTWYVPEARVVHRWGASTSQVRGQALRWMAASEYLYFRKNHPAWTWPLAWILTRLELATHLLTACLRWREGG